MALRGKKNNTAEMSREDKSIEISAEMQGSLVFKDPVNLKINGNFSGSLQTAGTLTIGETGTVNADITGDNIVIAGRVDGDINASTMIVLMPTAIFKGNLTSPKLNIVEGAIFNGNCQMTESLLDINQVAKYLELDISEIEDLAASGKIPATKNGNSWKFDRTKVDSWASSGKVA